MGRRPVSAFTAGFIRAHHGGLIPLSEDGEEAMLQDTDSDVAEQRDGGKVKVKWTQEEVIVMTCPSDLHVVSTASDPVKVNKDSIGQGT